MPLSERRRRFVERYKALGHGARAAVEAGFSPFSAASYASKLLADPEVRAALGAELVLPEELRRIATGDEVLRELTDVALVDPVGILDDEGRVAPFEQWPPDIRRAVRKIKLNELGFVREVELHGKLEALDKLGKRHQLWREQVDHHVHLGNKHAQVVYAVEEILEQIKTGGAPAPAPTTSTQAKR